MSQATRGVPGQVPSGGGATVLPVPGPPGQTGPQSRAVGATGRRVAPPSRTARTGLRGMFADSPGRLRLSGVIAVLAALAFGISGALAVRAQASALADARADAAQLIRVQQIATDLVQADSTFTNGYLAYGLESSQNLSEYSRVISDASALIVEAAAANPADADGLKAVNQQLTQYTARVAAARANNAQGFQVATGYLRQASDLLRGGNGNSGMLPSLQTLIKTNTERVDSAYAAAGWAVWWLVGTVVLALGVLVAIQVRLARRTRRYVNLPLALGSAGVLLVFLVGLLMMLGIKAGADKVHDSSYSALRNLASGRIAAYTAKSAESISLIYIGTGGSYTTRAYTDNVAEADKDFLAAAAAVPGQDAEAKLGTWKVVHDKVLQQASTDWAGAARAATSEASGSLNATFTDVDGVSGQALRDQALAVDDGLSAGRLALPILGWIILLVGIAAAVASWAGISQRLEEYR